MNIPLIFPPINHLHQEFINSCLLSSIPVYMLYSGELSREKLSRISENTIFMEKTFHRLLTFATPKRIQNDENFGHRQ